MISSITCSNCGSKNDIVDSYCLSCGSKLPSSTSYPPSDFEESTHWLTCKRYSLFSADASVYDYTNPDIYYKIKLNRNITKFWALVLFFILSSSTLLIFFVALAPSSPSPSSSFFTNFWLIYLVFLALAAIFLTMFFVQKISFYQLYTFHNQILGDIVPVFNLKKFTNFYRQNSWFFRSSSSSEHFTFDFLDKNSCIAKSATLSYSVKITKQVHEWFIVKDQQNNIVLKVLPDGAFRSNYLTKNFLINYKNTLDILFVLFLTTVIVKMYFTEKIW